MLYRCRNLAVLLIALFVPLLVWSTTVQQQHYKVAIDAEYAPYEFRDVNGQAAGMLPDLLRAMGQSAGIVFDFIPMTWPDAVAALQRGDVDIINMIRTPERMNKYEFSAPHSIVEQALFRNKQHQDIEGIATLSGSAVAFQKNDIANDKMVKNNDFKRIIVNSKADGFLKLDAGKVAAFFSAEQPGLYFLKEHHMQNVELAGVSLWPQSFCFAAKKGNRAIITLLDKELAALKQSGRFDRITRGWHIKPDSWLVRHSTKIIVAVVVLVIIVLALWFWVFMLRRTVREQIRVLAQDHANLEQKEAKFRTLFELSPIGLALCDLEGKMVEINPAYARMIGYTIEEVLQLSYWDITPKSYAEKERDQLDQLKKTGHYGAYEKEYIHQDGHRVPVRLNGLIVEQDGAQLIWSSVEDVSIRKQAEAERERLFSIVETSPDLIAMADTEGEMLYINPAGKTLLGIADSVAVTSLNISDLHSLKETKRLFAEVFPKVRKYGFYQAEALFLHHNGEEIPTLAGSSIQSHADGSPASYSVIAHDLRAERNHQKRMEHTQRLESLGVLAGGIAHDFNNILTGIMGNAALAERKITTHPEQLAKYLSNIVLSSERAAELCKQMLAYSGKGKFVVCAINLSQMVKETTKLLEISISKSVDLQYHLDDAVPAIDADAAQMQQVIMNLVINASDAIGASNGTINIRTGTMYANSDYLNDSSLDEHIPEGEYVFLEVSDTGCGMDSATQQRMFEPFFTTKFTGRGLGMSAVLGIIHGHHGTLKVYSELEHGTAFKMLLPISTQSVNPPANSIDDADSTWQGCGTILIVDDEEAIRESASMMLEAMGFTTRTAADGVEGVEIYRQFESEITVVLLDMTMPKLDGKGCFSQICHINPEAKVILSSGYSEQEVTNQFVGRKLAGFIQKPYLPERLKKVIKDAL